MKKYIYILVIVLSLSGCGIVPTKDTPFELVGERDGYREYLVLNSGTDDFYDFATEHQIIKKRTEGAEKINIGGAEFIQEPPVSYTLKQPYFGGFTAGGYEFQIVESGRIGANFILYKDGKNYADLTKIIGEDLCWGFDGFEMPFADIRFDNEKLSFTYLKGECGGGQVISDVYLDGESVNEKFGVTNSRDYFVLKGKEIFIAEKNNQDYLFVDGKPLSNGFDSIRASFCCAMPHFFLEVYSDGKVYFIGERAEKYYLVEVVVAP